MLSGLVLENNGLQWDANEWPELLGGWRQHHASVTVSLSSLSTDNDNSSSHHHDADDVDKVTIVLLGGQIQDGSIMNSVLLLQPQGGGQ